MTVFHFGLIAVLQLSLCLGAFAQGSVVDLGYSQYQGTVDTGLGITNFLGIRYAAAPVGNLRWAAPQSPPTVSGVQQANTEPNECHQGGLGGSSTNPLSAKRDVTQSEDCLFLNVHVPGTTVNPAAGLPVVVWIHGGGYVSLSGDFYDGSKLVFQSQNSVISVVINYRLGLFGFLPGQAVKSGGAPNAGLLDQNFALQWVQQHVSIAYSCMNRPANPSMQITKFGGDPSKVTIWGQSAGAGSVLQHVVASGGNTQPQLFRAAMTSSTYMPPQYNYNDAIPEFLYNKVVSGAGCSSNSDTLSCLRNTDIGMLSSINNQIESNGFHGTATFVPVVDGSFIVERPTITLGQGKHNGEALYSITNMDEGSLFVDQSLTISTEQYISELFPNIQASQATSLAALYAGLGTNVQQSNAVMGEAIFVCPTYYLLKAFGNNAWKGEFAVSPSTHGSDIGYYFTNWTNPIVTSFSNSFLAMVKSENPNAIFNSADLGLVPSSWNSYANGNTEMIFNMTSAGALDVHTATTDSGLANRCAAWLSVAANTSQ
ncbi:Alpha/Beta hydrolase protein [Chiua virens]|nr:Alpha/Beta hydrolase protein [Chiua virens]